MKKFSTPSFRRVVYFSAFYDLVVTSPFGTPWSFRIIQEYLSLVNQMLGGGVLPIFEGFHLLMANLLGSLVIVWSILRLRHPEPLLGRYDGAARMLFSLWMAFTLVTTGEPILWLFLVPELTWGVIQWWPVESGERHSLETELHT